MARRRLVGCVQKKAWRIWPVRDQKTVARQRLELCSQKKSRRMWQDGDYEDVASRIIHRMEWPEGGDENVARHKDYSRWMWPDGD